MRIKIFIIELFCLFLIGCSLEEKDILPNTSAESFKAAVEDIFGLSKSELSSGIGRIQYSKDESVINYHFYPTGYFKFEDELGVDLAPKIKRLYEIGGEFDRITFLIKGYFEDKYGKGEWLPVLSFEFNKTIYYKVNWENFLKQNLLEVSENVKWFRRIE
jgi:hypothetical protein